MCRLWDRLEENGVPSLRSHTHGRHVPHFSYAVLRSWQLDDVRAAVDALSSNGPVEFSFDGLGTFRRGRTWLIPALTSDVAFRQERVVEAVRAAGAELHRNYVPGAWIPHCTLAPRVQLTALSVVAAAVYDVLPLRARADHAALIDSGTGERWPLRGLP
nr:2'-5' RNA ligase family protein [Phytoactinopolyspora mesophila]